MRKSCQFCKHYNPLEDKEYGECRQKPPKVVFHKGLINLHETTVFPKVRRNDWCGKHEERPK